LNHGRSQETYTIVFATGSPLITKLLVFFWLHEIEIRKKKIDKDINKSLL